MTEEIFNLIRNNGATNMEINTGSQIMGFTIGLVS